MKKKFGEENIGNGMIVKFSRLLDSDRKKLKGIIDHIEINGDLTITKEHGDYYIRRSCLKTSAPLYIIPEVSNGIKIPDAKKANRMYMYED
jgi:hypothetical protein